MTLPLVARSDTEEVRTRSALQKWANGLHYVKNEKDQEELLDADGGLVMTWMDKKDLEKCAKDLLVKPCCTVLEVGFGLGYCADIIHAANPVSHVIIECAPVCLQRAREWAQGKQGVSIIEGSWQTVLPRLGTFDRLFFDGCRSAELSKPEFAFCSDGRYGEKYNAAMLGTDATPATGFEAVVRAWHCTPEARIQSGDGTEFQQWADSFFFSTDRDGNEQLLDVDGLQVMMKWEKSYMEECAKELNIDSQCDVLEVGFGCGYSANRIQAYKPRSHTIIECSDAVLERLHEWGADKPNVNIVEGTWQSRLPDLGLFDCIFFDDYGLPGRAEREMSRCPKEQYKSEYTAILEEEGGTHFEAFMNIALKWHGKPGSRMSGYMTHQLPEGIAEQNGFEESYRWVGVAPPVHCNYFFSNRAAVPLFTRGANPPVVDQALAKDPISQELDRTTSAGSRSSDEEESGSRAIRDVVASTLKSGRTRSRSPRTI